MDPTRLRKLMMTLRQASIMVTRAVEEAYDLPSCVITKEERVSYDEWVLVQRRPRHAPIGMRLAGGADTGSDQTA